MSTFRARRVATVLAASLAALAAWALFRAAGVSFHVSTGGGRVGAGSVVVAATLAALAGWLVVRTLEHRLERPRLWWMRIGVICFEASIAAPFTLADGGSAIALAALHLVAAVVIVGGLATTLPVRRHRSGERAGWVSVLGEGRPSS